MEDVSSLNSGVHHTEIFFLHSFDYLIIMQDWGHSGRVLNSSCGSEAHQQHCVVSFSKTQCDINPWCLVLVQLKRTHPNMTEKMLTLSEVEARGLMNLGEKKHLSHRKQCAPKIAIIFIPINLIMCFGCLKEQSH